MSLGLTGVEAQWVGRTVRADVFDRTRWRHFGRSDGLIWDDCNTNAFLADPAASVDRHQPGSVAIQPQPVPPPSIPPQVVFTSVKLGGTPLDPAANLRFPGTAGRCRSASRRSR